MAHIVDGILSTEVTMISTTLAACGVAYGLKKLDRDDIPKVALISAAFLVASTLRIPLPGTSAHLLMAGLMGLTLGWQVFPAVLIALVLQLAFFGFGGLISLGPNLLNIAGPAMLTAWLVQPVLNRWQTPAGIAASGFAAGLLGVGLVGSAVALSLSLSGQEFWPTAQLVLASHGLVMGVEGLVTASALALMIKVRPDLLRLA